MAVVVETTLGDITIDLYTKERPRACLNFLKLCKIKYYNYNLFHTVGRDFIAQTGDPTGSRKGGESIYGVLGGSLKRYFEAETHPRIKHTIMGLVSFVGAEDNMIGSQFFITLAPDLSYLDDRHCVFGEVAEGLDVLELLNDAICDNDSRPYQDIRITHTVVLDDPYPDVEGLRVPSRSPSPSAERLQGGRIAPDEEIDETTGKDVVEVEEIKAEREAKARATILEMVGDIPDAEMAPPENVLFVCKLNPVTTDDDLEIIFSRFGKINSCEVIRDRKTGDSLQYAFIEFDDNKSCEDAYFKMDNVLIDDRRIHVDFSQSVAKVKWLGKGRGVAHFDDNGRKIDDKKNDIGKGNYKSIKTRNRDEDDGEKQIKLRDKDRNRDRGDRERTSRYQERSQEQRKPTRNREEQPKRYKSPDRERHQSPDRRRGRYPEERGARYRPNRSPDRRSERSYRPEERRGDYYANRSHEQSRRRNRDRSNSQDRSRSVQESRAKEVNKTKRSLNVKESRNSSVSSSEDESRKKVKKSKGDKKDKKRKSSSSSEDSTSEDDRKKSKGKSHRQKRKSESEDSSDDSEDDYKKKKKDKRSKK